jgi:hypothetical protein
VLDAATGVESPPPVSCGQTCLTAPVSSVRSLPLALLSLAAVVEVPALVPSLSEMAVESAATTPIVSAPLVMGSADPHQIGAADRAWKEPIKRAAFSVLQHCEADWDDLMSLPFPEMNAPPKTDVPPAPRVPAASPPVVTMVEQIIPRASLKLVRAWKRRLRRCIQFAEMGEASMARRMRPDDLWLPVETHMTEATRPWVWDLRPLDDGLPAVPLRRTSNEGVKPKTGLRNVSSCDPDFPDAAVVQEMLDGIEDDVSAGEERGTLLCGPHSSALKFWSVAQERVQRNVDQKWSYEHELPCWPLRACPFGVVDESERAGKAKWRLTNDLSWPPPNSLPSGGGSFVVSHNAAIDRSSWPAARMVSARDLSNSAAIMMQSGAPVHLWSVDCDSFYRIMGRQGADVWRNVVALGDRFQVDERCCFGSAADAAKCVRVSNFLVHHAREAIRAVDARYPSRDRRVLDWAASRRQMAGDGQDGLSRTGMYVDDAAGASFADVIYETDGRPLLRDGRQVLRSELHFEAMRETLLRFGHSSNKKKEQPPASCIDFLGVKIDLGTRMITLLDKTRDRYAKRVRAAIALKRMGRRDYLRLMGRLTTAAFCFPRGRQFLNAAWRVGRARFRLHDDSVPITAAVRRDLRWWAAELEREEARGVPLASPSAITPYGAPGVGAVYADASGEIGWGAWTVVDDEVLISYGFWTPEEREGIPIHEKELFASTVGLFAFAEVAGFRDVWSFTDNTVALAAMRTLTPTTVGMQEMISARLVWMESHGVREAAERITSKNNLWSDMLSRDDVPGVCRQAEMLGYRVRVVAPPMAWRDASLLLRVGAEGGTGVAPECARCECPPPLLSLRFRFSQDN